MLLAVVLAHTLGSLCAPPTPAALAALAPLAPSTAPGEIPALTEVVAKLFEDLDAQPDGLNELVSTIRGSGGLKNFLEDIDFQFKVFDEGDSGGNASLGFEYAFSKSIENWSNDSRKNPLALALDFHSQGNVAFEQEVNPSDFLDTGISLHVFQHRRAIDPQEFTEAQADAYQQALIEAAAAEDPDQSPAWLAFMEGVDKKFKTQGLDMVWDASVHASLESNQDFSSRQFAYGLDASLILRSLNPDSAWSRFNLFDYPAALGRMLTGFEPRFTPSGEGIPRLRVGLDLVDPEESEARAALTTDDDPYPRLRAEIGMSSRFGELGGKKVRLRAKWRYYRELDAPSDIEGSELEDSSFFETSLELQQGWRLSYTCGRLPLDLEDSNAFALGFQVRF